MQTEDVRQTSNEDLLNNIAKVKIRAIDASCKFASTVITNLMK